jgi:hypothetical protein
MDTEKLNLDAIRREITIVRASLGHRSWTSVAD